MANAYRRFRVQVNGVDVELVFEDGRIRVDDTVVACTLERLSDGWYHLNLDGVNHSIYLPGIAESNGQVDAIINGKSAALSMRSARDLLLERFGLDAHDDYADKLVCAPMPGLVLETLVKPGTEIKKGDGLLVLEAMKMENEIRSVADGTVKTVHVSAGDAVTKNQRLVELE